MYIYNAFLYIDTAIYKFFLSESINSGLNSEYMYIGFFFLDTFSFFVLSPWISVFRLEIPGHNGQIMKCAGKTFFAASMQLAFFTARHWFF